jgi:hypothetical protein
MSPERSATLPIGDLAKTSPPTEKLEAGGGPVGEDRSSLEKGHRCKQGVTKRCRLSLLTNSAIVIRVQTRGEGEELLGLSQ